MNHYKTPIDPYPGATAPLPRLQRHLHVLRRQAVPRCLRGPQQLRRRGLAVAVAVQLPEEGRQARHGQGVLGGGLAWRDFGGPKSLGNW